jgi:hypothetical protein
MRTSLLTIVAWWLLVAAGAAVAQSYTPAQATDPARTSSPAAAAPPAAQPAERPRLMLRLDELDGPRMSFGPSATEKYPAKDLPSLGGNPRPLDQSVRDSAFPAASNSSAPTPY